MFSFFDGTHRVEVEMKNGDVPIHATPLDDNHDPVGPREEVPEGSEAYLYSLQDAVRHLLAEREV